MTDQIDDPGDLDGDDEPRPADQAPDVPADVPPVEDEEVGAGQAQDP